MATQTAPSPDPEKSGHKTLWLVIIALLLILVAGAAVAGTYFFMNGPDNAAEAEPRKAKVEPPPKPVFVAIKPFTANIQAPDGRVLYVRLALKVADEAEASRINEHMPQIRNRILITLTDAEADRLISAEGKQALARRLQGAVAEPLTTDGEPIGVSDVLFTDFIVQ